MISPVQTLIFKELEDCKTLWNRFSPQKSIFDLWEFRVCFWAESPFEPAFVLAKEAGNEVGLLPLWYSADLGKYLWFGDIDDWLYWGEDHSFWVKNPHVTDELLKACPGPFALYNLKVDALALESLFSRALIPWNPKNILSLEGLAGSEDYLQKLGKKLRQNLRRDVRKIEAMNPKIHINRFEDLEAIFDLNREKFSNSPFHDPRMVAIFHRLIHQGKTGDPFGVRLISIEIDNEILGGTLIFTFNGIYYPMVCGHDTQKASGIGNYLNMLDIDEAIKLGMKLIDFSEGEPDSYKNNLFDVIPQFALITQA